MKFLADENVERPIVEALRKLGYDILYMSEIATRTIDEQLLMQANRESRILLTNDKDFGELVYLQRKNTGGVLLMRFGNASTSTKVQYMISLIKTYGDQLEGHFAVVTEKKVRLRRL